MRRITLIAVFMLVAASTAKAETYYYHGSQCNSTSNVITNNSPYGLYNWSWTPNTIWCGSSGMLGTTAGPSAVTATVYDRSTTTNVSCQLTITYPDGTVRYQNTQYTSGASYSPMTLTWSISNSNGNVVFLNCSIPGYDTTYGYSYFTSYNVVN